MRKLLLVITAALLVAPMTPSKAAPEIERAGVDVLRMAFAAFLHRPHHGPPSLYFGAGIGFNVAEDHAFAGRGPCKRVERRGRKYWSCSASARGVRVLPTGFYMDPLLQTGHMELERGGYRHYVDWSGKGDPHVMYGGGLDAGGVSVSNRATATGRLFGHRFPNKRERVIGFMGEAAYVWIATDSLEVRLGRDDRLHVNALVPVRGN